MKVLSFFLLIPFAAFAGHPTCQELQDIAKTVEVDVKKNSAKECKSMSLDQMVSGEMSSEDVDWFKNIRCGRFSAVEAEIAKLENQLSVLKGFEYLKQEIKDSKSAVAETEGTQAQAAGRKFVDALNTAQSLESLLNLPEPTHSLSQLQAIPLEERDTPEKFKTKMQELCIRLEQTSGVCASGHHFSEAAVRDINALLSQRFAEKNGELLSQWSNALKITRLDGAEYSFSQMAQDFNGFEGLAAKKIDLSRDQLKEITNLPDFQNAPSGLEFLKDLKNNTGARDVLAANKFKFLVEDLKKRQELEVMSKLSTTVNEFQNKMNEGQKTACIDLHVSNIGAAPACLAKLKEVKASLPTTGDEKAHLDRMIKILEPAVAYHGELDSIANECLNEELLQSEDKTLSEACQGKVNLNMAAISQRLQALTAVKNKIVEENNERMILREFALYKWKENCEEGTFASVIEQCGTATEQISSEVIHLTDHVSKIALSYLPKSDGRDEDNAKALCETENWSKGLELDPKIKRLCDFFRPETESDDPPTVDRSGDSVNVGLKPGKRDDATRDAWARGLGNLSQTLANALRPRPQYPQGVNPYYFANNPYNSGLGLMSPSDRVLYQAQYYGGYGYYFSTPGATPYTAFPTSITPYTSLSGSRSPYFTGR